MCLVTSITFYLAVLRANYLLIIFSLNGIIFMFSDIDTTVVTSNLVFDLVRSLATHPTVIVVTVSTLMQVDVYLLSIMTCILLTCCRISLLIIAIN